MVGELTNPFYAALVVPIVHELDTRGYLGILLHDGDIREPDSAPIFDGVLLTTTSDSG